MSNNDISELSLKTGYNETLNDGINDDDSVLNTPRRSGRYISQTNQHNHHDTQYNVRFSRNDGITALLSPTFRNRELSPITNELKNDETGGLIPLVIDNDEYDQSDSLEPIQIGMGHDSPDIRATMTTHSDNVSISSVHSHPNPYPSQVSSTSNQNIIMGVDIHAIQRQYNDILTQTNQLTRALQNNITRVSDCSALLNDFSLSRGSELTQATRDLASSAHFIAQLFTNLHNKASQLSHLTEQVTSLEHEIHSIKSLLPGLENAVGTVVKGLHDGTLTFIKPSLKQENEWMNECDKSRAQYGIPPLPRHGHNQQDDSVESNTVNNSNDLPHNNHNDTRQNESGAMNSNNPSDHNNTTNHDNL